LPKKRDHKTYEERYGKERAEEIKAKISATCTGQLSGEKNPMYGRCGKLHPSFGKRR
jgi:hypothetical protein